jgi:hypothetical protein
MQTEAECHVRQFGGIAERLIDDIDGTKVDCSTAFFGGLAAS